MVRETNGLPILNFLPTLPNGTSQQFVVSLWGRTQRHFLPLKDDEKGTFTDLLAAIERKMKPEQERVMHKLSFGQRRKKERTWLTWSPIFANLPRELIPRKMFLLLKMKSLTSSLLHRDAYRDAYRSKPKQSVKFRRSIVHSFTI